MRTQLDLQHGSCTLVSGVTEDVPLVAEELAHAAQLPDRRAVEFIIGRAALRLGLRRLVGEASLETSILSDSRGAPILPAGWVGSISHKDDVAAGLVAPDLGLRVGVDIERAVPARVDIGSRVLTAKERARLAPMEPFSYGRALTLRFSLKEAIYKAVDPFVRRYVGFQEVELDVHADGRCTVRVLDPARLPLEISAAWVEHAGYWVTSAAARPWAS